MKEFCYVLVAAALVCLAHAELGAECEGNDGCNTLTEFCNKTRVCRWRLAGGWFPYFACQPDGECAAKQGFNMTCRFDDDCASSHCRMRHCVTCGNDSDCSGNTYCDRGFIRFSEPNMMKIKEHRKEHMDDDGMEWSWDWDWGWNHDDEMDDEGEFYGERFGRHDRHDQEDRRAHRDGDHMGWWKHQRERNHRLSGKLEHLYDKKSGIWMKYIGTVVIKPTFQCLTRKADGNTCIHDTECVSGTCDGGKCVAANARQCTWNRDTHTSVGCAQNFDCHGGWDPLVPNICVNFPNCTTDADCSASGRFCDPEHKKCVQCSHDNYSVCGSANYCYWGMCRPRITAGFCDRWWMCSSGQCRGWTQECARVTTFTPGK